MITFNAEKLACVALHQSNEQTRYYLCGVYFEGNIAVATDGHILGAATDENSEVDAPGIYPVSKKAITAMKHRQAETVEIGGGMLSVRDEQGEARYIEPCQPIDGTFPDWRSVIPSEIGEGTTAGFSHITMRKVCEVRKTLNGMDSFCITGQDATAPHFVTYTGVKEVFTVIMPERVDAPQVVPGWLHESNQATGET